MAFQVMQWDKINPANPDHRAKALQAVNDFLGVGQAPEYRGALKHFTASGDWPTQTNAVLEKYHELPVFDLGWQETFKMLDFTSQAVNGWKIMDIGDDVAFVLKKPGESIEYGKMYGAEASVSFLTYGAGLQWNQEWFDDQDWVSVEDSLVTFRVKEAEKRASVHYGLIETAGSLTAQRTTWQVTNVASTDANYTALRDMATLNKAAETIISDMSGNGMGVDVNTVFTVTVPIALRGRIARALGVQNAGLSGDFPGVQFNFKPVVTSLLASSSYYYVSAPGHKCQSGNRKNLEVKSMFSQDTYSTRAAGWTRFGAAVGETKQIRRCAIA